MLKFLGIGAQKAGTTWLYFMLRRHPQIYLSRDKELHFWDWHRDRGLDWYRSQFAGAPTGSCAGEITPAYAILAPDRIAEIAREFPHLKLIYLMRDPRERAWSSAKMALGRAEMTLEEASDQWFIDHFRSQGSLSRGDYAACLKTWFEVFPRERFLIARYERLTSDPANLLAEIAEHLSIDPEVFRKMDASLFGERRFEGEPADLRPSLRPVLEELYRDRVGALEALLSDDFSDWRSHTPT